MLYTVHRLVFSELPSKSSRIVSTQRPGACVGEAVPLGDPVCVGDGDVVAACDGVLVRVVTSSLLVVDVAVFDGVTDAVGVTEDDTVGSGVADGVGTHAAMTYGAGSASMLVGRTAVCTSPRVSFSSVTVTPLRPAAYVRPVYRSSRTYTHTASTGYGAPRSTSHHCGTFA